MLNIDELNDNQDVELQELTGTVESVTYRNESNGYTVFSINNGNELINVVGEFPAINGGDILKLKGKTVLHRIYGEQFSAESFEYVAPTGVDAILRYLSSGAVRGIGPATALKIIEKFGEDTLSVIEKEPERLALIRGISLAKAKKISMEYADKTGEREAMLKLASYNITPKETLKICKVFGQNCSPIIEEDPYRLCDPPLSYSFERADKIARVLSFEFNSPQRINGGILYVLRHNIYNGHTCLPEDKLCEAVSRLTSADADEIQHQLNYLCSIERVVRLQINDRDFIFIKNAYDSENYIAGRLSIMANEKFGFNINVEKDLLNIEKHNKIEYGEKQKTAILEAFNNNVMILTGGPGTGKTTTLKAIIQLIEQHDLKYHLAAPTGRAAKRMTELTGREASTLHRLLEVEWDAFDNQIFKKNENSPLNDDVIIVDELSMVDIFLFEALLRAMRLGCKLILVGDSNQLPAVGAGNVLGDLIVSGIITTVTLDEVFRQALKSLIIVNAHRIIEGKLPEKGDANSDFFVIKETSISNIPNLVSDLCSKRLPDKYGFDSINDIQVLCPTKMGNAGTVCLNECLRDVLNPPAFNKQELFINSRKFRVGDKVMQTKNNYDIVWTDSNGTDGMGIYNGDIGIITSVDRLNSIISVRYDSKIAMYSGEDLEDLDSAYAVTVHKSQGSEYDCVVIPISGVPLKLCYRNLLYTAVTRAKKLLVIIGTQGQIESYIANDKKQLRYTGLITMINNIMDGQNI